MLYKCGVFNPEEFDRWRLAAGRTTHLIRSSSTFEKKNSSMSKVLILLSCQYHLLNTCLVGLHI